MKSKCILIAISVVAFFVCPSFSKGQAFQKTYNFVGSINTACCNGYNYGFTDEVDDTTVKGNIQITSISVSAVANVVSPDLINDVGLDWEVFVGTTSFGLPIGPITGGQSPGAITSSAPTQLRFAEISSGSAGEVTTFTGAYNFQTNSLTTNAQINNLKAAFTSPLNLSNGLFVQAFIWSGASGSNINWSNISVTVTGTNAPLQITTSALLPASVGTVGRFFDTLPLGATGGTPFPSASYSYPYTWSANSGTGLPWGLYISYFTGEISGLPAVAGDYSTIVTVHDFNGMTATRKFGIGIAANPKQSIDTIVQNEYYSLLANHFQNWGSYYSNLSSVCTGAAAALPVLEPLCGGLSALASGLSVQGVNYSIKASDPADTNYTVIAQPIAPSLSFPSPDSSWTPAQTEAYGALHAVFLTTEQIIGLSNAEVTSVNRATGAYQAGNTYWLQQQLAAQKRYSDEEAFDLQLFLTQMSQLKSVYSASGFPDFSVSPNQEVQFELGVSANGLPSDLQQQLTALGVDSEGMELLKKALASFNPNTISGDILHNFVPPDAIVTTIQQLRTSFITPFAIFTPKVDVSSAAGTFELLAPFTLGTGSNGINPSLEDVSVSLGPFAITIPASSFILGPHGYYQFSGAMNGISVEALLKPASTGYTLHIDGSSMNLATLSNPLPVTVQIGDDGGTANIASQIQ